MPSLNAIFDCATDYRQELEKLLLNIRAQVGIEQAGDLVRKVEEERSRVDEFVDSFDKEVSKELPPQPASLAQTSSAKRSSIIESSISNEKKSKILRSAAEDFLAPTLDKTADIIKRVKKEPVLGNTKELPAGICKSKGVAERMWRRTLLISPSNEQEFEAALRWAWAQGEKPELEWLEKIESNLPYSSPSIPDLIRLAKRQIKERLAKKQAQYKVLCDESDLAEYLPEYADSVQIVKAYGAFLIVVAAAATMTEIKKHFPVELLKPENGPIQSSIQNIEHSQRSLSRAKVRDYIVRFKFPIQENWKTAIKALGATILQPLKRLELVVSAIEGSTVEAIKAFEEVEWVTPYTPSVQVRSRYLSRSTHTIRAEEPDNAPVPGILIASFFTSEDKNQAIQDLEQQDVRIVSHTGQSQLVLDVGESEDSVAAFEIVANLIGLRSLGEKRFPKLLNDKACPLIGRGVIPCANEPTLGLTGKGEIIAIADGGLDNGNAEIIHPDFKGRVRHLESYPIVASWSPLIKNIGDDCGAADKYSGHGTHVAGSAVGDGKQASFLDPSAVPSGMASEAELIFQSVEQAQEWTDYAIKSTYAEKHPEPAGPYGLPEDLTVLFEHAYERGARIHSNSWGVAYPEESEVQPGDFDFAGILWQHNNTLTLDRFIWEHKEFLVVASAGNEGVHNSDSLAIEPSSLGSPADAKNCLTVGASENDRQGQSLDTYTKHKFEHEPFISDGVVDSVDDIAAFSSRGPCRDGRLKPDIVAPGTLVLSTRSSQLPENFFPEGFHPPTGRDYMFMSGTSMATPLVAGCAAVVRQYFREQHHPQRSAPSAALLKATLIHSAQYVKYRHAHESSQPWADNEQGWGRVCLNQVLNPKAPTQVLFIDEADGLEQGEKRRYTVTVQDVGVDLRVTLVYTDHPGNGLINNLNLVLRSPSRAYFLGNDFSGAGDLDTTNNVEGVVVEQPEAGTWRIDVVADVSQGPQDYAMVISGGLDGLITN